MKKNLYIFIIKLNFDNYMLAVLTSITSFIAFIREDYRYLWKIYGYNLSYLLLNNRLMTGKFCHDNDVIKSFVQ